MLPIRIHRSHDWDEPFSLIPRELDRMWKNFWESSWPVGDITGEYPVDIREDNGSIIIDAEVPGFKKDEIEVNLDHDVLKIKAERKMEKESEGTKYLSERRFTRIERAFTLPAPVDETKVSASLDNGILHLELHKKEDAKSRRISIK